MVRYCIAEKTTGKMKGTKALPKDAVAGVGEKIREQGGGVKDTTKIKGPPVLPYYTCTQQHSWTQTARCQVLPDQLQKNRAFSTLKIKAVW